MARNNITKVISCFANGAPCRGDSKATCSTTGDVVFSYSMPIAWRTTRCEDHDDCVADRALGEACAREHPIRVIAYEDAPTATTKSQVRALAFEFGHALRVRARTHRPNDPAWQPPTGRLRRTR